MDTRIGTPPRQPASAAERRLRLAHRLSAAAIPLIGLAAAVGLASPAAYRRNPAQIIPALQGQDLVSLLALPALAAALYGSWRGSARATLIWLGLLSYMAYTYTGASLGYYFDVWTPLYIALFSLTVFAVGAALGGVDAEAIARRLGAAAPRRATAGFLALIALLLVALELGQIAGYILSGELPAGVVIAGGGSYFVYGLDLGVVVPLALLGAVWLWRGRAWGFVVAGVLTVKATTMGLALLAMNWYMLRAGQPLDAPELLATYALLAAGGAAMGAWLLARRPRSARPPPPAQAPSPPPSPAGRPR